MVMGMPVAVNCAGASGKNAGQNPDLEPQARQQIETLIREKLSRTPAQRKINSQLLYLLRQKRQGTIGMGLNSFKPRVLTEADGRVLVDLKANVSPVLLRFIQANAGLVVNSYGRHQAIRALIPVELAETLANRFDVRSVRPAARAMTSFSNIAYEGGDIAHRAAEARRFFSAEGAGVKIGVLSDSIDGLTNAQATGALPDVTILPGQAGNGSGEGTAMLEIVHALSPGSELFFATAFNSEASFAQNIRDLYAAGCRIIIDDVTYFNESPFQDGPIAQAVNDVSAGGALYFSSAGNSGGVDRGTSGTWEGDFKDGGQATIGQGGRLHDFGGLTYNTVLPGIGFERLDLTWSDPLGQSTNDYDLYVLDSAGNVISSSTDNQNGTSDPYESINSVGIGERVVIVKYSGDARFLHLSTGRGHLTFTTPGTVFGHNAAGAANAFCVAATRVATQPAPFVGGAANPLETFSSDGPRHVFYKPDGTPITPGDLSSTGGAILQKPDLTAADGVNTTVNGFAPFLGTSAAAPHLGAIAALLWSYNPFLTPASIRSLLTSTALPITSSGYDRNSGFGIAMAYPALAAAPQAMLKSVQLEDANQNGRLDPNECANLVITLSNPTTQTVTGITAVLSSRTAQLYADPTPHSFPDLLPSQSVTSTVPFQISTGPGFVCGSNAVFQLDIATANIGSFSQPFEVGSSVAGFGSTNVFVSTNGPTDIPDMGEMYSSLPVSGIALPLTRVRVSLWITHTYDQDLRISLVSPDNTEVLLSANNGQSGENYGQDCQQVTQFDDDATNTITSAAAPFIGVFAPEEALSAFAGKSGPAVNGTWKLHVQDQAPQDVGTLRCWSLELTPIGCADGGGQCLAPPELTQDLSNQVVTNGANAQLSVLVSGTGPLVYQWYYNTNSLLSVQTNASLILSNIAPVQSGVYQVVITNLYGSVTSAPAELLVVLPAGILAGPTNQVVTNGATVLWQVAAQGTPPVGYQWFFNQTNLLAGETNSTLVLSNVTLASSGVYQIVVTNAFGSVTSAPAMLTVLTVPVVTCSPDTIVQLGTPWDFAIPIFTDTNLTLQVLGTQTNAFCGETFAATRQWSVTDSNGIQVFCSQTVQVVNTNPPVFSCPTNKSVISGTAWTFDTPMARQAFATEALVYDNWTNNLQQQFDPGQSEVGNQVTLAGTETYPSRFTIEYWGTNAAQSDFAGRVTARIRFYKNDGVPTNNPGPGTMIFDSGSIGVQATNNGILSIQNFQLDAALPLVGSLPSNFTWTVTFSGLGTQDAAGLVFYGPPVSGESAPGFWQFGTNGWTLAGQAGQAFGAQLAALSGGVNLTVSSTVTNQGCGRSFTATRSWLAVDACSNSASCSQTVTVLDEGGPLLVDQSHDQTELEGQTVALMVNVSSCPPIGYQWYFNQSNLLAAATNATLSLTNVSLAQAGIYQAVITNDYGSVTSAPINLLIVPPPTFSSVPSSLTVTNGDTAEFDVAAQGTGNLSYQWLFSGAPGVVQATNSSLVLSNVTPAQGGTYQVVVSDAYSSITSAPVRLTVLVTSFLTNTLGSLPIPDVGSVQSQTLVSGLDAPLGRVQVGVYITHSYDADLRISLIAPNGASIMLSSNNGQFGQNYGSDCSAMTWFSDAATTSIVSAGAPFVGTFRPQEPLWIFNGLSGAALNGVWTLKVEDTGPQDTGTLQCWSLELDPMGCPAGGGPCLMAPQIVQDISDLTVTNRGNTQFQVAIDGTQPLAYQWFFNGTNALPQGTNATLALTNVDSTLAGQYEVVVSNLYGAATSSVATLRVVVPAAILVGPSSQIATNGDTVTFGVQAQGTAPLTYQWFFDSTNMLAGQTNSVLVLSNATPALDGTYDVVVANAYASTDSAPANLTVRLIPHIVCSPGTNVYLGMPWGFTPPAFSDTNLMVVYQTATNALCGESFSVTRTWVVTDTNGYQVTCAQTIQILDTNPPVFNCPADKSVFSGSNWGFDTPTARDPEATLALVYDNWTNNLNQQLDPGTNEVGDQITLSGNERYPALLSVGYWGTNSSQPGFAGQVTAQVRFYTNDGPAIQSGPQAPGTLFYDSGPLPIAATNSGVLAITDFQLSAAVPFAGALPSNFTWTVQFSGLGSNDAAGLAFYGPPVQGQAANGYWVAGTNGWALTGTAGQNFGSQLSALSSGAIVTISSTVTNPTCQGGYNVTRTWNAVDACGNSSSCSQTVTIVDQVGPVIVSQPQDQALLLGQTLSMNVGVTSCPPTGVQWYFNFTNAVPLATNTTLVITNISTAQAGLYLAVITNVFGSVTSATATVTVDVPAVIVGNPADQVATNGTQVHWRVLAKGSAPLSYQWFFNVTNVLAGETNSTLDLTNVGPAQAGAYQVVVTNLFGSATSAPAFLTIVVPPAITNDLENQTATNGNTVVFSIGAVGSPPLFYQWYFNNGLLGLETNATLVLSNVIPAQAGVYQVVVGNVYGSVTSAPANLTIVVIPNVVCSPDLTVPLGSPWDFTPPVYTDTNLSLQVVQTTTNALCGNSYSANRQWLITDTNGYQVTCSQTVTVQDPVAPVFNCPTNKTALYGSSWAFDLPLARESGAVEAIVYDNWTNDLGQSIDPGTSEIGAQVTLSGTQRYLSKLSVEYWGTNATQSNFTGQVTARVRFYLDDGPSPAASIHSPGTVFYDSGPQPIIATNRGALVLNEFQLSAAVPLTGALPASFTWTVLFEGLGDGDSAGLNFYGPPVVGQSGAGYWILGTNGWTIQGQPGQGFGSQLSALSSGVNVSVLSTVTNVVCGQNVNVTRNWLALDGCSNAAACSQTISVLDLSAPRVTSQPKNQSTLIGQNVSFTVGVACPPSSYQWYFNQTNILSQATNSTLSLTNVTLNEAGIYQVVLTNVYGSTTSAPAILSLSGLPLITTQPLDAAAALGGSATFTAAATGYPAPSYQWLFNDTNVLSGETNSSLTLTNIQSGQAGFYSVIASNTAGTVTSSRAKLTILQAPVIITEPASLTVLQGQQVLITVSASGTGPLQYQWMANCSRPISGATGTSLRLKSVSPTDSGSYCVRISNPFGTTESQPAVLRVLAQAKLSNISSGTNGAALSFSTVSNLLYSVYVANDVATTNWTVLPNAFQQPGTGAPMTIQDPGATGSQRFYKIVVQ